MNRYKVTYKDRSEDFVDADSWKFDEENNEWINFLDEEEDVSLSINGNEVLKID